MKKITNEEDLIKDFDKYKQDINKLMEIYSFHPFFYENQNSSESFITPQEAIFIYNIQSS